MFVCPEDPPAALNALAEFGIALGPAGAHPGQGTANAVACFDNAYLEILWGVDEEELDSELVRPLALRERTRWRELGASPFGIAFRLTDGAPPGGMWGYRAAYLPAGSAIPIVTPPGAWREPLVFQSPGGRPPPEWPVERRPPLEHRGRPRRVTGVVVEGPEPLSAAPRAVGEAGLFHDRRGPEPLLELTWDGGVGAARHDFRPFLPLVLRW